MTIIIAKANTHFASGSKLVYCSRHAITLMEPKKKQTTEYTDKLTKSTGMAKKTKIMVASTSKDNNEKIMPNGIHMNVMHGMVDDEEKELLP